MERFELVIGGKSSDVISMKELSYFLSNFQSAYELAYKYAYNSYQEPNIDGFRDAISSKRLNALGMDRGKIQQLDFSSISTNSPLKFIGYCTGISMLALSLAVAIAGGDADLNNRKFKVNSLADAGIRIYETISNKPENDGPKRKIKPKRRM